jgi:hypothetical protein
MSLKQVATSIPMKRVDKRQLPNFIQNMLAYSKPGNGIAAKATTPLQQRHRR